MPTALQLLELVSKTNGIDAPVVSPKVRPLVAPIMCTRRVRQPDERPNRGHLARSRLAEAVPQSAVYAKYVSFHSEARRW